MEEYICRTGCARVLGVEVLTYRISLPKWEKRDKISEFYAQVEARTLSFCETALRRMAERCFDASEDPKKRFHFPAFRYGLEGRVTWEDTDTDLVSVCLTAELKQKGDCLESCLQAHTWSLSEEVLLPPEQIAERLALQGRFSRKMRKKEHFLVKNRTLLFLDGDTWSRVSFPD